MVNRLVELLHYVSCRRGKGQEIKESAIEEVRRHDSPERREHRIAHSRDFQLQGLDETLHAPALEILLRAAEITGDERIPLEPGKFRDVRLPAVCKRADDRIPSVLAA